MPLLLLGTACVKLSNVLWKTYIHLLPLNIQECLIFFPPKLLRQLVWLTVWKMCWENFDSLVQLGKALCHLRILSSLGNPLVVQFGSHLASVKQCKSSPKGQRARSDCNHQRDICSRLTWYPFPYTLSKYAGFPQNGRIFVSEHFPF